MQLLSTLLLAAMAAYASAEDTYEGMVYFDKHGNCPDASAKHPVLNWYYSYSNLCLDKSKVWDKGNDYSAFFQGGVIGANAIAPKKFGGCPTSSCDSNCYFFDIDENTGQLTVADDDCVQLTDSPYIYIGD